MRTAIFLLIVLMSVVTCSNADRIIFAPTGSTLSMGQIRAEAAVKSADTSEHLYWGAIGLGQIELSAIKVDKNESLSHFGDDDVVSVALGLIPETPITPGVSVGVWNIGADESRNRGYYMAASKSVPMDSAFNFLSDLRLHVGVGTKGTSGVFGGIEAGLPKGVRISAEYFQHNVNFALNWAPIKAARLKVYWIDGDPYYGVEFSKPY